MHDGSEASQKIFTPAKTFREILNFLNAGIYGLLSFLYQIFFNIAGAQLFSTEIIKNFYGRVQLIIGVFMLFKLAISVINGIIDPDKLTDSKTGFGSIVIRVITALAILTMMVPINMPSGQLNEFEQKVSDNGLLFGTLYSLQNRILANNTLGRIILGDKVTSERFWEKNAGETQNNQIAKAGDAMAATILRSFVRMNLEDSDITADDEDSSNWICEYDQEVKDDNTVEDLYNDYKDADNVDEIFELTTVSCVVDAGTFPWSADDDRFILAYSWLSVPVGILFAIIIGSFCIDIAIRTIKLAILRLIAPIPIISYMDPKSGDNGAFSAWVKALTTTYLDLFFRIAVLYFVVFLVQQISNDKNGIIIAVNSGMVGIFTKIFIYVGLFFFAKEAPKFIKQVLGIKDDGNGFGFLKGLGRMAGVAAVAAGTVGAAHSGFSNTFEKSKEQNIGKRAASAIAGVFTGAAGAVGAAGAGAQSLWTSDKDYAKNAKHSIVNRVPFGNRVSNFGSDMTELLGFNVGFDAEDRFVSEASNYLDNLKKEATKGKYDPVTVESNKFRGASKIIGKSVDILTEGDQAVATGQDWILHDNGDGTKSAISVLDYKAIAGEMQKEEMARAHEQLLNGGEFAEGNPDLLAQLNVVIDASQGVSGVDYSTGKEFTSKELDSTKNKVKARVIKAKNSPIYRSRKNK